MEIVSSCRLCEHTILSKVLSLRATPPANEFLKNKIEQKDFPLDLLQCDKCKHVMLGVVLDPGRLFKDYVYTSGVSKSFVEHFRNYAYTVSERFQLNEEDTIVEIGSNDGTLLSSFKKDRNITKVLGIDPAIKIAEKANNAGITTWCDFFGQHTSGRILQHFGGPVSLVIANNVFAHIHDLKTVTKGIRRILAPWGVFVFEIQYLTRMVEKCLFDMIYHEHLSYHSVHPLYEFFKRMDMELFDVIEVPTHGGSIRGFAQMKFGPWAHTNGVSNLSHLESRMHINSKTPFLIMDEMIHSIRIKLLDLLKPFLGKLIGFGAPAKATTLLYSLGLIGKDFSCIVDDSQWKQGMFSPGMHIPIKHPKIISVENPPAVLVLAWNFSAEIAARLRADGYSGKIIRPLPTVMEM